MIRTSVACIVIDEAVFVLSFPGQAGTDGQLTDIDPIIKKKSGDKFLDCYSILGPSRPSSTWTGLNRNAGPTSPEYAHRFECHLPGPPSHLKSESKTERTPKACGTQLVTFGVN